MNRYTNLILYPILLISSIYAADGALDPTFGTGGIVSLNPGISGLRVSAATVQPDNNILLLGRGAALSDCAVLRLTSAGALDTSFNGSGYVTTASGATFSGQQVIIQPDNKILCMSSFRLIRYESDGSLDSEFDGDGILTLPTGGTYFAGFLNPGGQIITAGTTSGAEAAYRLSIFTNTGTTEANTNTTFSGPVERASFGCMVQLNGKILTCGRELDAGQGTLYGTVLRYLDDGTLDTSFATAGRFRISEVPGGPEFNVNNSMVIQPDSSIVVMGTSGVDSSSQNNILLFRIDSEGNLDTTFNTPNGFIETDMGSNVIVKNVILQPDGKILVFASISTDTLVIARYTASGVLDNTFGSGGIKSVSDATFAVNLGVLDGILLQDGKILFGCTGSSNTVKLLRYENSSVPTATAITSPLNGAAMTALTTITGRAQNPSIVWAVVDDTVFYDDAVFTIDEYNNFTLSLSGSISPGEHTLRIFSSYFDGNENQEDSISFTIYGC